MGRKGRKGRKKGMPDARDLRTRSPEQLERYAHEQMEAGKPRQARDAYKELVRLDRERYLPQLLKAYVAQARRMAEAGQEKDARGLLDLVRSQDPSGAFAGAIGECEAILAAGAKLKGLGVPSSATTGAAAKRPRLSTADAALCLDQSVEPPNPRFAEDLTRIQTALEAITRSDFEAALEQIRPIGFSSEFADWKLLVRGMAAFYRGDDAKCLANLERIAPETVAGRVGLRFRILITESDELLQSSWHKELTIAGACRMAGYSGIADDLARAEYLWMTGRYRDAYRKVRSSLKGFPSLASDVPGIVTRMFFTLPAHLMPDKADKYLAEVQREVSRPDVERHPLEAYLTTRATVRMCANGFDDMHDDEVAWEEYLALHERMFGKDTALAAEIHARLGHDFSRKEEFFGFESPFPMGGGRRGQVVDAERAEAHLKKSLKLDTTNREGWRMLLDLYERTGRKAEHNRTMDRAIEQFPDDKVFLHRAAQLCFERAARRKGLGYLERAHRLDPLDRAIRAALIEQRIAAAADALRRHKEKAVREEMDLAEAAAEVQSRVFRFGRQRVLATRAVMEDAMDEPEAARAYLTRARAETASPLEVDYFALLACHRYGASKALANRLEQQVAELTANPDMAAAATLISVFSNALPAETSRRLHPMDQESARVRAVTQRAKRAPFERSAAVVIVRFLVKMDDEPLIRAYAKLGLKADSRDTFFRVARHMARKPKNSAKTLEWLRTAHELRQEANQRNDEDALILLREGMEGMSGIPEFLLRDLFDLPDPEEFDEEFLDEDAFDIEPPPPNRRKRGRGSAQLPDIF